jgi:uncharacterized membrane protein (UPF0127 family)
MFYRTPPRKTLLLPRVKMIHMFFVFFPLGILVLDKNNVIIDKFIIKPWRVSRYYTQAECFLETPDISALPEVHTGDVLDLSF